MQTTVFIPKVRQLTSVIKNSEVISAEQREKLQAEIESISRTITNPTLMCLRDLADAAKAKGFSATSIESQILEY